MAEQATPKVVYGEDARAALLRGMDLMVRLLRPTLGPVARSVIVGPIIGSRAPEVLDSGATIARRTYSLASRSDDVGAMLVRHLAWRVHEEVGDGSATAVVLAGRLVHEADRVIAAGASPVGIRRGIERGVVIACAELRRQARPVDGPPDLLGLMRAALGDEHLAQMLAEVADSVGADGAIMVENAYGSKTEHEYVEGVRWNEGWLSPSFRTAESTTLQLIEPRILVTDVAIERPEQLVPALEACIASGSKQFFVVAPSVSDAALGLLLVNRERGVLEGVVAVRTPSIGAQRTRIAEDLAVVTGGRCILSEAGERLESVTADDLGTARQVWARQSHFGILGGRGGRPEIRARIAAARAELKAVRDDDWLRDKIRERIGKLAGSAAVVLVGAATEPDRDEIKARVEAAVSTARAALRDGLVAGGGAAYAACAALLEREAGAARDDESVGLRSLGRTLTEPMAQIARNSGLAPEPILHAARERTPGLAFDVLKGEWVDPWETGLLDSVAVLDMALRAAASLASTTLMSEVLVHHRNPETTLQP